MTHTAIAIIVSGVMAVAGLAGCARDTETDPAETTAPKPAEAPASDQAPAGETEPDTAQDPDIAVLTITAVAVDTRLAAMCGIPESEVFFKYDSTKLRPEAKERLDKIAACVKAGPAKDQELLLVGRAGPIGKDKFNQQLGMSRAESVQEYLRKLGVDKTRIETESKGEEDAFALFPGSWPEERRVTIRLQPKQ